MLAVIPSESSFAHEPQGKSEHILALAKELLDDIELTRLPAEALLLKATRLAGLTDSFEVRQWLVFEMLGFNGSDPVALKYMTHTGRWTNYERKLGYWGPLAQQEAEIAALKLQLQSLRVPDINYSLSSANPNEWVGGLGYNRESISSIVTSVINESRSLVSTLSQISAVRSKVIALIHNFVARVYYEKAFSSLTETIFEQHKLAIDALLAERCADVLERIPSIYNRLVEGDIEAISQALSTCRRIIDSFADAIYPPSDKVLEVGGQKIQLGQQHHQNRINAYVLARVSSKSRRQKVRQSLANLYDRVTTGVHSDVTIEEARSLFLETYLLLGEILTLSEISTPSPTELGTDPVPAV